MPRAEGPIYVLKYHPQYHNLHPYLSRRYVPLQRNGKCRRFLRAYRRAFRDSPAKGDVDVETRIAGNGIARHEP